MYPVGMTAAAVVRRERERERERERDREACCAGSRKLLIAHSRLELGDSARGPGAMEPGDETGRWNSAMADYELTMKTIVDFTTVFLCVACPILWSVVVPYCDVLLWCRW